MKLGITNLRKLCRKNRNKIGLAINNLNITRIQTPNSEMKKKLSNPADYIKVKMNNINSVKKTNPENLKRNYVNYATNKLNMRQNSNRA